MNKANEAQNIKITGVCDHAGSHLLQNRVLLMGRQVDILKVISQKMTTELDPLQYQTISKSSLLTNRVAEMPQNLVVKKRVLPFHGIV